MFAAMEGLLSARIPRDTVVHISSLTGLAEKRVKKILKRQNIRHCDAYLVFDHAKKNGLYAHLSPREQKIACLRSIACLGRELVEGVLHDDAASDENVLLCLGRLLRRSIIQHHECLVYVIQYLLACSQQQALEYASTGKTVLETLSTIHAKGLIDEEALDAATNTFNSHVGLAQSPSTGPARDTRAPPNVTSTTRVIAVLGLDEPDGVPSVASPSEDGWMVSDFYLWLHVLHGMGKSQEWITSMAPSHLLEKYGREDIITNKDVSEEDESETIKPMRTKWKSGFVHGDPWEERVVVLDDKLLPSINQKLTIGPHGVGLRDFFLKRLEAVVADASKTDDPILILAFCHGDYDVRGGLYIGDTSELLCPSSVAGIMSRYPKVRSTMYMTSCFSGHWVETTELQNNLPTVLAAAGSEEDSFGFVWSHSQRHAGGLFSSATISELIKDPAQLPEGTDPDLAGEYSRMTADITAEMYRLCLPGNIPDYGSSPVFTDPTNSDKFWHRTGYALHHYKANYDALERIPASDPHPKRNRKKYVGGMIDGNEPELLEWTKRHPGVFDEDYPEATAGYGSTRRGLRSHKNMNHIIGLYKKAQRGCEAYSESKLVQNKINIYQHSPDDFENQVELRRMLIARLALDDLAGQYRMALGLHSLPPIQEWDPRPRGRETDKFARIITDSKILGIFPRSILVYSHRRPAQYLAAEMTAAQYTEADLHCAVKKLQQMRAQGAFTDVASQRYLNTTQYKSSVESLRKILRRSRSRVRPSLPAGWKSTAVVEGQQLPQDGTWTLISAKDKRQEEEQREPSV